MKFTPFEWAMAILVALVVLFSLGGAVFAVSWLFF